MKSGYVRMKMENFFQHVFPLGPLAILRAS